MTVEHFGEAKVPLSPAVRAGDFIYVSGQVPVGADGSVVAGGVAEQTDQVMANIEAILKMAGCTLADVVKTHCYLADRADFAGFNEAYAKHFPGKKPARTTAEARLMIDIAVEIEAIAYKPL